LHYCKIFWRDDWYFRERTSMKVKANGIDINYLIDGPERAPWLVFSNSLATSLSMWDEQMTALKDSFRVLRYDQRGHGGTDAPAGRYAFDTLLADALGLMDALKIEKAHFAGLSMGGATALGLAERQPQRFHSIVVADSPCQSTPQSSQQWEERIAVAQKQGIEALVEPTVARWFPPETVAGNPPHLDKIRAMIRATPVNGFIGCAAALAAHDYASAVASVKCPTLFIVGEKDGATPAAMDKLHEKLAGSRFVTLPGAGHISNMDRPGEFSRALREFLQA
jgi:3-oxoadipate enol-lactonase